MFCTFLEFNFEHHFGQFRTCSGGFLFRGFLSVFLAAWCSDAICVKRSSDLAKTVFGPV
jgi:hypothetical protein